MKPRKVIVTIISIPDCPACDRLKDIVQDLWKGNQFLNEYVIDVEYRVPDMKRHTEFPIFQIRSVQDYSILYEAVGCYGQATIMWKLIKWIVPNGE